MKMEFYRFRKLSAILIILFLVYSFAGAAGIIVPRMELYTYGTLEGGDLILRSNGNVEMELEGGYKLGGNLVFRMNSENLEVTDPADPQSWHLLEYKYGSVSINDLFNIPLDFTYFVGEGDLICEGSSFTRLFGTWNFSTNYAGYLYFPNSILFEGISKVDGTGLSFSSDFGKENIKAYLYTYQDNSLGLGYYSSIGRFLFNMDILKLECFLKGSYPYGNSGLYSGGLMFYLKPAEAGEFFAQIGVPEWDPEGEPFGIDNFYFLFEPRLNLGMVSVVMTYFLHPGYYLYQTTNEEGNMDLNLNFMIGKPEVTPISGGLETTFKMASGTNENFFNLSVSPYFGAMTSGVVWDCKLKINIIHDDSSPMFEGFIGIKAEF